MTDINLVVGGRFNANITAISLLKSRRVFNIYTSSPPKKWGTARENVNFIPMPFRVMSTITNLGIPLKFREADAAIFGRLASMLQKSAEILHGWASFSLESAVRQKKTGGIFLLDRACPHAAYQRQLLLEEADLVGIKYNPMTTSMQERMEEEYELADKILVPSAYTYNSFLSFGYDESKLQMLRLDANFLPINPKIRSRNSGSNFVVGAIGGNIIRKGFLYLVEAWKRLGLRDAKLLIKTSHDELRKFPKLIKMIEMDPTIEIIGYVSEIEKFYDRCDVFCVPSVDDGFGMVVMEALACGLPVIATTNVGASEFIVNGINGYKVPIRDSASIAGCIEKLYTNADLCSALSSGAITTYKKYVTGPNNYQSELLRIYGNASEK